jgi:NAD(P)-dependent dehydrogenase (short-subunit alcohol dehydrogenase family)
VAGTEKSFQGQTVVISGGSKGLGLALAEEFGLKGAHVVIFARTEDEVHQAAECLRWHGISAEGHACDVADRDALASLLRDIESRRAGIDVLVNNAGIIQVGPMDSMLPEDFQQAMDIMLWGMVHGTLAVLPGMKARQRGRIVNITSLGGKVAVPHVLPYATAKFAAVGFSEGLRAELAGTGVKAVTVVPGLMRTGSFLNAEFHGETRDEFAWFSLAASTPGITIPAESAARRIVKATRRGEAELILSLPANVLTRLMGLLPGTTLQLLSIGKHVLPKPTGQLGKSRGSDLARVQGSRVWDKAMVLGHKAAEQLQPAQSRRS